MNDRKPMPYEPASWVQAGEAATDVGADDDADPYLPEGAAIAVMAVFAALVAALLLAHFVAGA